jgi:hypothetical protein
MCNRKNCHSHQKCTNRLHNSYTAKIDRIKAIRIKNFKNVSHPLRMTELEVGSSLLLVASHKTVILSGASWLHRDA